MRRAELGNRKRLISDDAKMYARNQRGPKESLKQTSWEAERISWLIVLARGGVGVQILPPEWGVNGEGLAIAVEGLEATLRGMLGREAQLPRVLFTDRGTGMYAPSGHVVHAYSDAVSKAGFRLYWGADARRQSPDMGDLLLHETAVSWFCSKMRREKPVVVPWAETRAQWTARAAKCLREINAKYNVAGLGRDFPSRLQQCKDNGGERLRK